MLTNTGRLRGKIRGGASGTSEYPSLKDKPQINGVTLEGNQTPEDLQMKLSQLTNDAGYAKSSIVAPEYSEEATYDVGDYVTYENTLYKCNSEITTAEEWNPEHWTAVNVAEIIPTKTSDLENDSGYVNSSIVANPYDETTTYAVGAYVTHENNLYKCNTAITTAEEWNAEHWTLVDVISAIPTKTSELDNDSNFASIDDTSTANDKAWSAGKIEGYTSSKYSTLFENLMGDVGKFSPTNTWYSTAGATGYSATKGVATFTSTAQYGGIKMTNPIQQIANHRYLLFGRIKASHPICLSFDGVGAVFSVGGNDFEYISNIFTTTTTATRYVTITDNNASGFGTIQAKEIGVIDLTMMYGDNIPVKTTLDAKVSPMGFVSLSEAGKLAIELYSQVNTLDNTVTNLENFVDTRTFKVIALGDSITAFGTGSRGWLKYFKERINCDIIANVAVDGAWLNDKVSATVYDGNPQPGDNNLNVLGNQVQKIINNNYDAPDLILIAVGTNSGISITEQQIKEVYFDNGFVALEDVDRTTSAGAYRWCLEKLHTKYPDAIIIWFSPIHGAEPTMKSASSIVAWGESLRIATAITGQQYIESYRCGICGYKEVMNAEGEYLQDGLHPNAKGAKKLGYYNASQVKNILMQVFST